MGGFIRCFTFKHCNIINYASSIKAGQVIQQSGFGLNNYWLLLTSALLNTSATSEHVDRISNPLRGHEYGRDVVKAKKKILDIRLNGDNVCDILNRTGVNEEHLRAIYDTRLLYYMDKQKSVCSSSKSPSHVTQYVTSDSRDNSFPMVTGITYVTSYSSNHSFPMVSETTHVTP